MGNWPMKPELHIGGVSVRIVDAPQPVVVAEIDDPICGTVQIQPRAATDIELLVPHIQCAQDDGELRASLDDVPDSHILFWGQLSRTASYLLMNFESETGAPGFSAYAQPCFCSHGHARDPRDVDPGQEVRVIDGHAVSSWNANATDAIGNQYPKQFIQWIGKSAVVQITAPSTWSWTDIAAVTNTIQEVDQETWSTYLQNIGRTRLESAVARKTLTPEIFSPQSNRIASRSTARTEPHP